VGEEVEEQGQVAGTDAQTQVLGSDLGALRGLRIGLENQVAGVENRVRGLGLEW
jgi:hypothetical protein